MKDRIELTDFKIETAEVLTNLLDIMTKNKDLFTIPVLLYHICNPRILVIKLAEKFDFVNELRIIRYQLDAVIHSQDPLKRCPLGIFDIAFAMDRHDLCLAALKRGGSGWKWTTGCEADEEKKFGEEVKGGPVFNLATYSISRLRRMSPEMIWVLLRVSTKSTFEKDALQAEHDVMAENFTRLMALEGEFDSQVSFVITLTPAGAPKSV